MALPFIEDARPAVDLAAIVETYSTLLFRIANSVLRSRTEAEDVVQDVFLRVLQHRHSLSTVRDMRVWLVRIAWNLALDRKRRKRPEQLDESLRQIAGQRDYAGGCGDRGGTALSFCSAGDREIAQGASAMCCCSPPSRSWTRRRLRPYWGEASRQCGRCSHERGRDCESGFPATLHWTEPRARISCTRAQGTVTCAAFIDESRMECIDANEVHRKSGVCTFP